MSVYLTLGRLRADARQLAPLPSSRNRASGVSSTRQTFFYLRYCTLTRNVTTPPLRLGHFVSELCVETFGGLGSTLVELIKEAAAMRGNKLTHGEYEAEATWSTRKFTPFVMQRISVAIQIAAASEIRQALGMSLALSAA